MALPTRNTQLNEIADIDTFYNGGKGSGNFGHSGRPGEVGGSAPSGSGMSGKGESKADIEKEIAETEDELFAVQDELQDEYKWGGNAGTAVLAHLESREEELQQKLGELVDKQKKLQETSEKSSDKQNPRKDLQTAMTSARALEKTSFGLFWGLEMANITSRLETAIMDSKKAEKLSKGQGSILDAVDTDVAIKRTKDTIADIDRMMSEKYRIESYGEGAKKALTDIKKALKASHKELKSYYDKWKKETY